MTLELLAENKLLREKVEKYEKAIEDIKAEIKNCKNKFFKNEDGTLSPYMNGTIDRMLEIIDKHIGGRK